MGFVQYFVAVLMVLAQQALTYPVSERTDESEWCSAGEYRLSRSKCEPCPANQYTTERNMETSCHRCFGDCRPELNMIVAQNCTSTSDLKCVCAPGFKCTEFVPVSMNCRECEKIQETTVAPEVLTSSQTKQTPPSAPSKHSSTPNPCQSPNCDPGPFPKPFNGTNPKTDHTSSQLAAILCPVVVLGSVALVILFCGRGPGDRTCFRQTIAKICHEERQDASHKTKESTHHLPRDSFSAKQQSSSSASNLGPVHVHNPGTVIFSLLNHFTGQVGPTIVGGKTTERINSEEEDERDCPVFHPTSPHSIHLSEEERSREIDSIFFPSQEQGKDCHVSKEEAL